MKRRLLLLLVALGIAVGAFEYVRHLCCRQYPDDFAWMRKEFQLSEPQLAAIKKLRADYKPLCEQHCSSLQSLQSELTHLEKTAGTQCPTYQKCHDNWRALAEECKRATRQHVEQIAAVMPPEQARRYLAFILPKLEQHDHNAPLGPR